MKIWRAAPLGAALLLFLGHDVLAQGSVIQGGPTFPAHAPMYLPGGPSGSAVLVDSGSASGAPTTMPGNGLSELLVVGRGTGTPPFANAGTGPWATNVCDWDGPLPNAHYACLSSNAQGGGLLAFGAMGSAAPLPVKCIVNGVIIANCLTGGLSVIPPFTITDNKTTTIPDIDTYVIGGFSRPGLTAQQIANWSFNFPNVHLPVNYDAVRGVADLVSGTDIDLVNGIAGYVVMNAPSNTKPAGYPDAVAQMGFAVSAVNNARVWGNNVNLVDNEGVAISSGIGRTLTAYEGDINFTSTGTTGNGLIVQGASIVNPAFAVAVQCGPLDLPGFFLGFTASQWSQCFGTNDYAAPVGLSIGKQGTGPGVSQISQLVQLGYTTDAGVSQNVNFYAVGVPVQGGGLLFRNTEGTLVNLNGAAYISPDYSVSAQAAFTTGLDTSISTTNSPSRTTVFQYSDSAAVRQEIFMKALGGDLPILAITSTLSNTGVTAGNFNAAVGFAVGTSAGVSCSGTPSSSFASVAGIVTHC